MKKKPTKNIQSAILGVLRLGVFLTDADIMSKLRIDGYEPGHSTVSAFMSGLRKGRILPPVGYRVQVRHTGSVTSTTLISDKVGIAPLDLELICDTSPNNCQMDISDTITELLVRVAKHTKVRVEYR